ncbi:aminotransferase class IV [Dermatobacter hominis]|uniref:aminotransferase class IV n=1 Tax=Dermatobacter hominis TaxID=2884263 RepID=UPI001D0F863A|nr:aminotransferase class IV [Dermatobacter hominis]UDY35590.1 aminotransferase class IV [Dermatobacter hominis]
MSAGGSTTGGGASTVLWIDGGPADPATAAVAWSDHGLTVGDGAFETIELRDGVPFALTRHLDRLERSCELLRFSPPARAELLRAVEAVAGGWGGEPGRLRITVTTGSGPMGSDRGGAPPTLIVSATSLVLQVEPTAVLTVPFTRNERGALAGVKSTSYAENVVALQRAREQGCSEAIFANTVGHLCEGTGSNVFVGVDGLLVTPPLSSGCLAGVTRALLLEALAAAGTPAAEADVPIEEWPSVDEAFLVSTTRHVQPISHVDGRALPRCRGPLTERAAAAWAALRAGPADP